MRRSDLLRAQWQLVLRQPLWILLFAVCVAITLFQVWSSATAPRHGFALTTVFALITGIVFTAAAVLLTYAVVLPVTLSRLRRTPGALTEYLVEINEDGLREVTDCNEVRVARGSARRLIRTRGLIIAVISTGAACVFPRRDFADAAAYDEFWKALQPLVRAHKS